MGHTMTTTGMPTETRLFAKMTRDAWEIKKRSNDIAKVERENMRINSEYVLSILTADWRSTSAMVSRADISRTDTLIQLYLLYDLGLADRRKRKGSKAMEWRKK